MTDAHARSLSQDSLLALWHSAGKHGVYQQLPQFLSDDFGGIQAPIDERWRGDRSRLAYLRTCVDFKGLRIVDIGANTGFFSLTLAHDDGASVTAVEPDPANRDFLKAVGQHYGLQHLNVSDAPVTLDTVGNLPQSDLVLLLNVLHHAGDDFDRAYVPEAAALQAYMTDYLGRLAKTTRAMIFQLGYNWCGNKATPILPVRRPFDMLDYLRPVFDQAGWHMDRVAVRFDTDDRRMVELEPYAEQPTLAPDSAALAEVPGVRALLETRHLPEISEFYARPLIICSVR